MTCQELCGALAAGTFDRRLAALYAPDGSEGPLSRARDRALAVSRRFAAQYGGSAAGAALFSGPGRTEIGGNHTDHQHGHVLCGSVDLDMLACAAPNGLRTVRLLSEGYPEITVSLDELQARPEEANTSAALVRGVAAGIAREGYALAGFDACVTSDVISGSGLSSSAAFEILLGCIFNRFSCGGALDPVAIAKIGQFSVNEYFGKPCGIEDQMGSSVGGAVFIDFADPAAPVVERIGYDFSRSGHTLCIIDTRSEHGDLTDDYAAIPREMGAIAAAFGKTVLREVDAAEFRRRLPELRRSCGDRAVLRAMHYFTDDRRAVSEAAALRENDFARFLSLVNASGRSSALLLQNTRTDADPRRQAVALSLAVAEELLGGTGAVRVHGGGFAGTIQAFVPNERLADFAAGMESLLGSGTCHLIRIRRTGGCVVAE